MLHDHGLASGVIGQAVDMVASPMGHLPLADILGGSPDRKHPGKGILLCGAQQWLLTSLVLQNSGGEMLLVIILTYPSPWVGLQALPNERGTRT
jgi:hypothetical protein